MNEIPRQALSEHFQEAMKDSLLRAAVFLTFSLDPGFFEEQILPVFFDRLFSLEPTVKILGLEEVIREQTAEMAVYYDRRGLEAGSTGPRLDIRYIPASWPTGFFHPKNLLLLVEDPPPADGESVPEGWSPKRRLIVAALSANLTQAGWWENVEACHVEVLEEDEKTSLRDDLLKLISLVRRASPGEAKHEALDYIRQFVLRVDERRQASADGVLHSRLYTGEVEGTAARESVVDFVDRVAGRHLREHPIRLEVISPYFDEAAESRPLKDLIDRFSPREVRVLLPTDGEGRALCRKELFDAIRGMKQVSWGQLPQDVLRSGPSESALPRRVHAKVYRFFSPSPRFEAIFVGSVNLTRAAHQAGGNFETGFLVETDPARAPDWWLAERGKKPTAYLSESGDPEPLCGPGRAVSVKFSWANHEATVFWDAASVSPLLEVSAQGSALFSLNALEARKWTPLPEPGAATLERVLSSTALLTVTAQDTEPATILVQEEDMDSKPSILLKLTVADILKCWANLSVEQKTALLEARYAEIAAAASNLIPSTPLGRTTNSFFDAFAGIFHSFGCLERRLHRALEEGRERAAACVLFGDKYDSLPHLLGRLSNPDTDRLDSVGHYLILLCASQLEASVSSAHPEFSAGHQKEFEKLRSRLGAVCGAREALGLEDDGERQQFLVWFEKWFLKKATPIEVAEA